MEEYNKRKRVRDDSEADSPESKVPRVESPESQLTRVNSGESCVQLDGCELVRVEPDDSVIDSSGVNEIHDDLLNILNDTDNVTERDPTLQGLDSVIKSFEEEILAPGPNPVPESGEFNPNLGYLLEASDDELGLPPTVAQSEET